MASVLSPPANQTRPSARTDRGTRWFARWAIRLVLGLPLVALAVLAHRRGFADAELLLLERRADLTRAGGPDLSGVRYAYPPVPVLLALVLPGGVLTLSIVTCLFSGVTLGYLAERLLRRLPAGAVVIMLAPLVAVPAMWMFASQSLAEVIALFFLAIALDGFVRFAAYGETGAGFTAGIALGLSYCADPGALLYGAVMCLLGPVIGHARYRDDTAASVSISAVLFFPVLALACCWAFLVWKFSGTFPGSLDYASGAHILSFAHGALTALGHAALTTLGDVGRVPLYLFACLVLFPSRTAAVAGLLLPVLALTVALWLGFAYSSANAYYMFTVLALTLITNSSARRFQRWLAVAAIVQVVVAIWLPPAAPGFSAWVHALLLR
jgi:hypothetical protein